MAFEAINIQNKKGFQSIRIPNSLKINDDKVYLKKVGNSLFIIPFHNPWDNLVNSLSEFTPDFMDNREQPKSQTRDVFD